MRPAPLLRKAFNVAPVAEHGAVVSARVYAAGLAWNDMSLNGAKTSDRTFLDPGFTSYDETVLYTTDDVTSLIRQDASAARENVIASQLGSGQYDNETTSGDWGWSTAEWRANPTLKADLVVRYADGTEQVVSSDATWKTSAAGPIRYDNHYLGETYDARRELGAWNAPGYDAGAWPSARGVPGPTGVLRAQNLERTSLTGTFPAGTRTEPQPRVFVWDTGQQRSGWATVSISGASAGTPIQIRYAEKLAANGLVSHHGLRARGPDPDRLLHRQGHRHGDVHAALHLQGLPVRADQRRRRRRAAGRHHRDRRTPCRRSASRCSRPARSTPRATCST